MTWILLTNDDGIDAPGLPSFAKALGAVADTRVVVPHVERSWIGKAITRYEDIRVESVGSGQEALDRFETLEPDLVMADVVMPEPSGYEICKRAKASTRPVPVLLLAGVQLYAAHQMQLGLQHHRNGDYDRALEHYARAFAYDPNLTFAENNPHIIDNRMTTEALLLAQRFRRRVSFEPILSRLCSIPPQHSRCNHCPEAIAWG